MLRFTAAKVGGKRDKNTLVVDNPTLEVDKHSISFSQSHLNLLFREFLPPIGQTPCCDSVGVLWSTVGRFAIPGNGDMHDVGPRPKQFAELLEYVWSATTTRKGQFHVREKQQKHSQSLAIWPEQ